MVASYSGRSGNISASITSNSCRDIAHGLHLHFSSVQKEMCQMDGLFSSGFYKHVLLDFELCKTAGPR